METKDCNNCDTCGFRFRGSGAQPCLDCSPMDSNWKPIPPPMPPPITSRIPGMIIDEMPISEPKPPSPTPGYYNYMYKGVKFDPYRAISVYKITCPALQHAFKKIIRSGSNIKTLKQDVEGAIAALQRKLEMIDEDK